ncbi:hypothetical protein NUW58_g6915 [Xylaria curta]|uniref:Uncharacterized protein n=1 Tax=Xylaria curta TaxID=42375 RepID=A0ACC1NNX2_9PEZI|nr:hypothetical protein NUW58_g6915 [Xylaria curta]
MKFATEGLAEVLGLDANGKTRNIPTAGFNIQSPGDTSKHIQTPPGKTELAHSREASMKRQGSMTGSKPNELIKTIAGKTGTPKTVDNATLAATASGGAASHAAGTEPKGATIDPQELLSTVTGLETGGNGAILDMGVYRALTPNEDTPASSKDSAASELNSDVSEGVALNVTLDMGFGTWDPFGPGYEAPNLDPDGLDGLDSMAVPTYPTMYWDDVNPDFDKPFVLDTSFFSLDAS